MDFLAHPLVRYAFMAIGAVLLAGLAYFVFLGVRALFREARGIARQAGHRESAATARAIVRMAAWALLFGAFYMAAFLVGQWLGWWAAPLVAIGLPIMIAGLLAADKLLTSRPHDLASLSRIIVLVVGILALFGAIIWTAAAR